jgi:hypothetical protein
MALSRPNELQDKQIGDLWREYKPLKGKGAAADLVLALLRKLVSDRAYSIPYGNWSDRLHHDRDG